MAPQNVQALRDLGHDVEFGVDMTRLENTSPFRYDQVVAENPRTGIYGGGGRSDWASAQQDARAVQSNRDLMQGFFQGAHHKVLPGGQMELTGYTGWNGC